MLTMRQELFSSFFMISSAKLEMNGKIVIFKDSQLAKRIIQKSYSGKLKGSQLGAFCP